MHHAYNAYVEQVLEKMTSSQVPLADAKRICRSNLPTLEEAYVRLADTKALAERLLAA